MVTVPELWLPIMAATVFVFVASWIVHAVLRYHAGDVRRLPDEDGFTETLRRQEVEPGDYVFPHAGSMAAMKDPAYVERHERGPVGFLTVVGGGPPAMGRQLAQWFAYCLAVSVFAAYVAGRAAGPNAQAMEVFRFATTVAFIGYALALWQNSIWYHRAWSTTLKYTLDGLIYAALTGLAFVWLWPGA